MKVRIAVDPSTGPFDNGRVSEIPGQRVVESCQCSCAAHNSKRQDVVVVGQAVALVPQYRAFCLDPLVVRRNKSASARQRDQECSHLAKTTQFRPENTPSDESRIASFPEQPFRDRR